jgi:hypothetical protein
MDILSRPWEEEDGGSHQWAEEDMDSHQWAEEDGDSHRWAEEDGAAHRLPTTDGDQLDLPAAAGEDSHPWVQWEEWAAGGAICRLPTTGGAIMAGDIFSILQSI